MAVLDKFSLQDQVIVVTGAGRGIGRGIAVDAAASGAIVIGCSRTEADLKSLETEVGDSGGRCRTIVADVTDQSDVERLVSFGVSSAGRIDGFVNNAGTNTLKDSLDYTTEEVDRIIDLNFRSLYWCCVAAARTMIDQGSGGAIVNITSQAGMVGAPGRAPYSGIKAGVNNLSRTFAAEWASHGIRVNSLAPTVTLTPLGRKALAERPGFAEEVRERNLFGRAAEVWEISAPAVFLLSPAASMITGHTLVVDGGWTIV